MDNTGNADLDCLLPTEASGRDSLAQVAALEELGHGVNDSVLRSEVVYGENVRVLELGDRLRLAELDLGRPPEVVLGHEPLVQIGQLPGPLFDAPLERVVPPFNRISYTDAIKQLQDRGAEARWGIDLGVEEEDPTGQFDVVVAAAGSYDLELLVVQGDDNPATFHVELDGTRQVTVQQDRASRDGAVCGQAFRLAANEPK